MTSAPFPDRDTIASKFASLGEQEKAYVALLMENAAQDENLIEGLHRHLNNAASAPFLNTLRLENLGKWIGEAAPARLQIRLMEAAKSSQHPAYAAFRTGLSRSGGLEKAYPPAAI
ncbi:hypothetical protein ATY81_10465 [Rhizobium sp. R72]|uniref:hypothetical protein n=1 Tax=unclassified Rhizobium TaxID=2613769 RepID=UPI000B52977F|nr:MULTISPECIES: hypothetical protein [unclassified Rhizobium]OWV86806.1 hypothetical protein ATY79_08280 [Rhizobium sp. R693]OWV95581.1 hypothetical protein ATY81_10465 [Rhizobium sp. R72]OWV95881.1 hypothetical protein ATY80_10465 [Rhizobium sp. R711]